MFGLIEVLEYEVSIMLCCKTMWKSLTLKQHYVTFAKQRHLWLHQGEGEAKCPVCFHNTSAAVSMF